MRAERAADDDDDAAGEAEPSVASERGSGSAVLRDDGGSVHGLVSLGSSVGGWQRALRGGDNALVEQLSVAHAMDVPVSARDTLQLGGAVFSEGGSALGAFLLGWRHRLADAS